MIRRKIKEKEEEIERKERKKKEERRKKKERKLVSCLCRLKEILVFITHSGLLRKMIQLANSCSNMKEN